MEFINYDFSIYDKNEKRITINLWNEIFKYLNHKDIDNCKLVSKHWNNILFFNDNFTNYDKRNFIINLRKKQNIKKKIYYVCGTLGIIFSIFMIMLFIAIVSLSIINFYHKIQNMENIITIIIILMFIFIFLFILVFITIKFIIK